MSRQRAADLDLGADEIVVSRTQLDDLHDDLYMLEAALDDAERDLDEAGAELDIGEAQRILAWILDAARPLRDRSIVTGRTSDAE